MGSNEQPYDCRWSTTPLHQGTPVTPTAATPLLPSNQAQTQVLLTSRSSCMERQHQQQQQWPKGHHYENIPANILFGTNNFQQQNQQRQQQLQKYDSHYDPRVSGGFESKQQLLGQNGKPQLVDAVATKAFIDHQNGKFSLYERLDKSYIDERQSPSLDTVIDPIGHSATPSPSLPTATQQPSLANNPSGSQQQIQGLPFVALTQPNRASVKVQQHQQHPQHSQQQNLLVRNQQQQVVLIIKDGQVVANGNPATVATSDQESVVMETLTVDVEADIDGMGHIDEQDLSLDEQLSPSLILEHAEEDDEETDEENGDDDYDPKGDDEEFATKNHVKVTATEDEFGSVTDDTNRRRSSRKRRAAVYSEEFDVDPDLDNNEEDDEADNSGKNSAERKKRKSTKPVKVTPEAAEDWTETEEVDPETISSRRKRNLLKSKVCGGGSSSWKKTNVWFGRDKMERYLRLKERCGFKSECALISRMLNLMEQSVDEVEQNKEAVADFTKIGKSTGGKNKRSGRASVHAAGDEVDEYCNVRPAEGAVDENDPLTNLCLRVSPEVRRCYLEMASQSKMTASSFLASLLLAYQKETPIDLPRNRLLLKEKQKQTPQSEPPDVCACPPPESAVTGGGEVKAKKKTKKKKVPTATLR